MNTSFCPTILWFRKKGRFEFRRFRIVFLLALVTISVVIFMSTMQIPVYSITSQSAFDSPSLGDFPQPFVTSNGALNCTIVVASSSGHGPCGAAHTMDVLGAILIGERLGLDANSGVPASTMDDYISSYDYATGRLTLTDVSNNLISVGGPGVNEVTWYYNNLRNESGGRVLPVYFDKDAGGVDYIHVAPTGNSYYVEYDDLGRVKADYGVIETYFDVQYGRHALTVAGLGGTGTWAASKVLSTHGDWSLAGEAVVIKYHDSDGDGYLDTITIAETVPPKLFGVYEDPECSSRVPSVDWGVLEPGSTKNVIVYIRNEGTTAITLSLNATNWNPPNASDYMTLDWDYAGQVINPGEVVQVTLTLSVSPSIEGITSFIFDIVVTGSG